MSDQQQPVQRSNNSDRTLSKQEADLIDETFNIMKNLNKNIEKVEGQKKRLEQDIQSLSKKIATSNQPRKQDTVQQEKKVQDYVNQNLILQVKREIVQEFEPLLKKLKTKSLSVDLDKDLTKVLEKELLKIKKEFDNERTKDKRSFTKKISLIEERLVDAIKGNEKLQKGFKKYEDKIETNIAKLFEKRLTDALDKTSKKFVSLYNASAKEIDTLKELVRVNRIEMNDNVKFLKQFKKDIDAKVKEDGTEFASFDAKINDLVKQNEALQRLIETFEEELHVKKEKEINQIEGQFKRASTLLNKKLEELDNRSKGQEELIVKQLNEMVDKINSLDKKSAERLQSQGQKLQETLTKLTDRNRSDMAKVKEQSILLTKKEREKVVEKFNSFKNELRKKVDQDVALLSKRLTELDKFEQEKDQLIAQRIDQITEAHGKDVDEIMSGLKVIKNELSTTIKGVHKQVREDYKETESKLLDKFHNELSESRAKILEFSTRQAEENADQIVNLASELRSQLDETQDKTLELIEEKAKPFETIRDELEQYIKEHQEAFELKEKLLASFKEELEESKQDLEEKFERVEAKAIKRVEVLSDDFDMLAQKTESTLEKFEEDLSQKFLVQAEENADQIVNLASELRSQLTSSENEYHKQIDDKISSLEGVHGEILTLKESFESEFEEHQSQVNNVLESIRERNLSIIEAKFSDFDDMKSTLYSDVESLSGSLTKEVEERLNQLQATHEEIVEVKTHLDAHFLKQAEENADQIVELAGELRKTLDTSEEKSLELISQKTDELLEAKERLQSYVEEKVSFVESIKVEFNTLAKQVNGYGKELEDQEELLIGKVNDIIELQEKSLEGLYAIVDKSQEDLSKQFKKLETKLHNDLDKKIQVDIKQVEKVRDQALGLVNKKVESLDLTKKEFDTLIDKHKKELSKAQDQYVKQVEKTKDQLEVQYKKEVAELDEKLARQTIKANEFMTKLETHDKTHRRELTEDLQKQFLDIKTHFEKEYSGQMQVFNEELRRKEQEYLEKILLLEEDKQKTVREFSDKISQITVAQKEFGKDKEAFEKEVTNQVKGVKKELDSYSKELEHKLRGIVSKERDVFERHESSFREVFGQKVGHLQEYQKERLDKIEKKFLDKNHKIFQDTIKEQIKSIETTKETALSAIQTLEERDQIHEAKAKEFYDNISVSKKELEKHIDDLFKESHKAVSKRLLEFDADFAQFKGVIVEEVNALMKDMKSALASSGKKQLGTNKGYKTELQAVEGELVSLRREHSELKSRVNNIASFNPNEGMNSVVGGLVDYENNLVSLVESLKRRGVSDETIKEALANKGHPRLYVSMILQTL